VTFDGAIPKYLTSRAAGVISRRLLTGHGRCTNLVDVPVPPLPNDEWVRVHTRLGGICGSDINLIRLDVSPSASPFSSFPFVFGHENVGEIAEVGGAVRSFTPGERVVVNPLLSCIPRGVETICVSCADGKPSRCENFTHGHLAPGMLLGTTRDLGGSWGEYYVAHQSQLVRVPESVSNRAAVLLEPFATAVSAVLADPPRAGESVLVIGGGTIGLLTIAALHAVSPETEITVLARHRFQAELAETLGARHLVVTAISKDYFKELATLSGGRLMQPILGKRIQVGGFHRSFVCVGNNQAVDDSLRFTNAGGQITLLGNVASLPKVDWTPLWMKELTLKGSLCYNTHGHGGAQRDSFDIGMRLLAGGLAGPLESLVTHVFPLDRYAEALSLTWSRSASPSVKIVLENED
jgi:threonine dehydrogenase-like Zn-dependent dehydrogenase